MCELFLRIMIAVFAGSVLLFYLFKICFFMSGFCLIIVASLNGIRKNSCGLPESRYKRVVFRITFQ